MPPLYKDGVLIAGDAAMLVNNVHWEGTNLAMVSGKLAAETAIEAIEKNDFTANMLSLYQTKLDDSFVLKDLKTYKDVMKFAEKNSKIFMEYYIPGKVNEFFNMFTTTDSIPKQKKYKDFIGNLLKERSFGILCDITKVIKLVGGILLR